MVQCAPCASVKMINQYTNLALKLLQDADIIKKGEKMTKEEAKRIAQGLITDFKCESETMVEFCNVIIKALEQEPCEDAISRNAVLEKAVYTETEEGWCGYTVDVDYIKSLPSVTSEPKTGHWIEKDGFDGDTYYDCSECGESWTTIEGNPWNNGMKYFPNCGAKMEEVEE